MRESERQDVLGWEAARAKALGGRSGGGQEEGGRPPSVLQGERGDLCCLLGCHRVRESSPQASYCCHLTFTPWAANGRIEAGKRSDLRIHNENIIVRLA